MEQKKLLRGCLIAIGIVLVVIVGLYFIGGDRFRNAIRETDMISAAGVLGEITSETVVEQRLDVQADRLTGITLQTATYARQNTGTLRLEVYGDGALLEQASVAIDAIGDGTKLFVPFSAAITDTDDIVLRITAPESSAGNAITLSYGNSLKTGRAEVAAALDDAQKVTVNGVPVEGMLCIRVQTERTLAFGRYYWLIGGGVLLLVCAFCAVLLYKNKTGKQSYVLGMLYAFDRYRFLMKQLVGRDFKTKYKRSVLGVLWSFLNPLLTMSVQYVVFSMLFRSEIENFILYLLIGIVCYGFFSEATGMTLTSIVGNVSLITKVYVPKYIYPVTRVISSAINFLLALIPIFAVMLVTGAPFRPALLLLPFPVLCLLMLCLGMGMLLAAAMVFFRDTQFLWNVISMLWMYLTPIFYPESIIPAWLTPVFKCNPLYHIIRFMRILLMDGVSPEPMAYLWMLIASVVPLCVGLFVFKKTQDKFVLYL